MKNIEDQEKYGKQHECMPIGEFLHTGAILTWRWKGTDYYAQYRGQTDTVFITLHPNVPGKWTQFLTTDPMENIYRLGADLEPD